MSATVIYTGTGRIVAGELRVHTKEMTAAVLRRKDCRVRITVEKLHATRSKPQNDYYWAVVVPRITTAFKARGVTRIANDDTTHEVMKSMFMDPELVRTGQIRGFISDTGLTLGTHTPDLNKVQFIEYLERIVDHAAANWDTYIPPPDPLWREHAEQEGD